MVTALECVILIGLPGAGKTTFYREKFAHSHIHLSEDLWPNASRCDARQQEFVEETLSSGKSIVIDNTNPTTAERARIIRAARTHGARVIGYFFDISTRAGVARNANRTGRNRVPNVAIFTTAKRLQTPTTAAGFDKLFRIEIAEDRTFRITKML